MNAPSDIKANAKLFVQNWKGRGRERQDDKTFWEDLLEDVFGIPRARDIIEVQKPVKFHGSTKAIDIYVKPCKVVIEQKSRGISLDKCETQSDNTQLTPLGQAIRYYSWLDLPEQGRYIITCNFDEFRIFDNYYKRKAEVCIKLEELPKRWKELAFLAETYQRKDEEEQHERKIASKASAFVRQLYQELRKDNSGKDERTLHSLNVFCVRIVFCLFAEDFGLFPPRAFHDFLKYYPANMLSEKFAQLFAALNTRTERRSKAYDCRITDFPYVNGGLFADDAISQNPIISEGVKNLLLNDAYQLGNPDNSEPFSWGNISPTNFGCIFESTISPGVRNSGGMHYTTPENIRRVTGPLFLDQLEERLHSIISPQRSQTNRERNVALENFRSHLSSLRILDPACGSGNFLTETYKALYRLDMEAYKNIDTTDEIRTDYYQPSTIPINHFYGIEINDFAASVARTSMWISHCQMLKETERTLGKKYAGLPLPQYTEVLCADALRTNWDCVLKRSRKSPIYIIGNPPFMGSKNDSFSQEQKESKALAMPKSIDGVKLWPKSGDLDFVCAWYAKAAAYMKGYNNISTAFVSTNSITQGAQAANLWEPIIKYYKLQIIFAWKSFPWFNKADDMAHVHCVIVGLGKGAKYHPPYRIYQSALPPIEANNINCYLLPAEHIFIKSASKPLGNVPHIGIGNKPIDNGNYLFSEEEKNKFIQEEPASATLFRPFYGAKEFIDGTPRYCLWLGDCKPSELSMLPLCRKRAEAVRAFRLKSRSPQTQELANKPTRFHVENMPTQQYIVVPRVSSERRKYLPIGFMSPCNICSDSTLIIPSDDKAMFGVLESSIHMAWMRAVCGRLKMDYRYSGDIVYNNFPWLTLTEEQKQRIRNTAEGILEVRSKYADCALDQLYDPILMPPDLVDAHRKNDQAVADAYNINLSMNEENIALALMRKSAIMSKPKTRRRRKKK